MQKKALLYIFYIILFVYTSESLTASINNTGLVEKSDQKAILASINAYRNAHRLNQLTISPLISEVAKAHSLEMANSVVPFGHNGFNNRMQHISGEFCRPVSMAENVALTSEDTKTVVKLWLNSAGHRKNIEGNFNLTGIGIARDSKGIVYVTQIFINSR